MKNNKKHGGKKWKINGKIGNLFSKIPDKKWRKMEESMRKCAKKRAKMQQKRLFLN